MSETLPETIRRLGPKLSVADDEVSAWPRSAKARRARAALLAELAVAAEADGIGTAAVTIAARIAAEADTARAVELETATRYDRFYIEAMAARDRTAASTDTP
ncbi:hypothetical protein ADL26_11660 [Thermoactinomyces vulgaris]|nr:hypothetical protein ADL26_11660 [Thermoactinomyces vulgaris]